MNVVQNTGTALVARRRYFPGIAWGGIIAGIIVGLAIQLVLALLGIAAGLTAVGIGANAQASNVSAWVGAWQSVSVLIAAFVGGYVAARMSGLQRKGDGMLHGLVAWGATTLIVALLTTSALGALFGRTTPAATLSSLANGGATQSRTSPELSARLDELIRNATAQSTLDAQATAQTMQELQRHIANGDRVPAIDLLVRTTGMPEDQATAIVDDALAFVQSPPTAAPGATGAPNGALGAMSWWMFGAAVLSMLLGIVGGLAGAVGTRRMRSADDRADRMVSA